MRRRAFIAFVSGAALWPAVARAQHRFKIGLLDTGIGAYFTVPFISKLEELGYVEGKNIAIERKNAEGTVERLNDFAADLVRQQVDVIVTRSWCQQRSCRCRSRREPCPSRRKRNRHLADGA